MHSNVRMVSFLVFAGFLAAGGAVRVAAAAALLALAYLLAGAPALRGLGRSLARLRYLWLSLLVLYFWFTPGQPLWPVLGAWSPTLEGTLEGAVRIAVLALMVAAAQLLLHTTSTAHLVSALLWLTAPLRWLGFDRQRFALRLVLVLETVPRLAQTPAPAPASAGQGRFARHVTLVQQRLRMALEAADAAAPRPVELPEPAPPPHWQWLYPLGLAAVLGAAGSI